VNNLPDLGTEKIILIAPLNWGLGHATRLISIVRRYKHTHKIMLAGNEPSLSVLSHEFPDLKTVAIPQQIFFLTNIFFACEYSPLLWSFKEIDSGRLRNNKRPHCQIQN